MGPDIVHSLHSLIVMRYGRDISCNRDTQPGVYSVNTEKLLSTDLVDIMYKGSLLGQTLPTCSRASQMNRADSGAETAPYKAG